MSAIDIFQAALALPYDIRSLLARQLIDSLHPPGDEVPPQEWEAAWEEEIERRLRLIESGEMPTLDAGEVHSRLRERLAQGGRSE